MGKLINMTWQRFGRLVAQKYMGSSKWLCKCDCGNQIVVSRANLVNGATKSCGCLAKEQSSINGKQRLIDLAGRRFGRLTVKEYAGDSKWLCECDCGNQTIVSESNLVRGGTVSCGCKRAPGVIGRKIDQLTVIKKLDNDIYLCQCDCGNTREVSYKFLMSGAYMSCRECATKRHNDAIVSATFKDGTQPGKIKLDKAPNKSNKSGVTGVNWDKSRNKWQASIRFKGKKYNLGRFNDLQDAIDARKKAEEEIFVPYIEEHKKKEHG